MIEKRFNKNLSTRAYLVLTHELVLVVEKRNEDVAVDLHQQWNQSRLRYTTVDLHSEQGCANRR